jgi:IstB-like ATP binding protein
MSENVGPPRDFNDSDYRSVRPSGRPGATRRSALGTGLWGAGVTRKTNLMNSLPSTSWFCWRDELGYVPATKFGRELFFDVIATACERSSGMFTTNLPFDNWTEALGSVGLISATVDRMTHRCKVI